jgi:hypothetical protein
LRRPSANENSLLSVMAIKNIPKPNSHLCKPRSFRVRLRDRSSRSAESAEGATLAMFSAHWRRMRCELRVLLHVVFDKRASSRACLARKIGRQQIQNDFPRDIHIGFLHIVCIHDRASGVANICKCEPCAVYLHFHGGQRNSQGPRDFIIGHLVKRPHKQGCTINTRYFHSCRSSGLHLLGPSLEQLHALGMCLGSTVDAMPRRAWRGGPFFGSSRHPHFPLKPLWTAVSSSQCQHSMELLKQRPSYRRSLQ